MIDLSGIDWPDILVGTVVSLVIGWGIWVTKWIIGHNKACHAKSNEELVNLRKDVQRVDDEIGHPSIKGSIMERQHRQGKLLARIRNELGISDDQ